MQTRQCESLEAHLHNLRQLGPRGEERALILEGQAKLERREFSAARAFPDSLPMRQLHCNAILNEGIDEQAAVEALRYVLNADPSCAAAKQNLQMILQRTRNAPVD